MSFVRQSKYRHVYGEKPKAEYFGMKITGSSSDGTFASCNPKFLALITQAYGGGSFMVIPTSTPLGRLPTNISNINGHTKPVTEVCWSRHNDNLLATGDDDGNIKIWNIPEVFVKDMQLEEAGTLEGHTKKITCLSWHPSADNVLLSASTDNTIRIWHVPTGSCEIVIECHKDNPTSVSWSQDGSLIATTCKDKTLRVIDIIKNKVVVEVESAFDGNKPSKCVLLKDNRIFAVGFRRMGGREYALWDPEGKLLAREEIDSQSGIVYPFYDADNGIVFLTGKGQPSISYYEIDDHEPYVHYLSTATQGKNMRGIACMPKRGCDPTCNEISKFYKLTQDKIEIVSMRVPRKSELFQNDIFPPFESDEPAHTSESFFQGNVKKPLTCDWRPVFDAMKKGSQVVKKSSNKKIAISTVQRSASAVGSQPVLKPVITQEQLDGILDDIKKLKATVRKLNKKVQKFEKEIGDAACDDGEEEE